MTHEALSIAIIGCGAMGGAIARALVRKRVCAAGDLHCYDSEQSKIEQLVTEIAAQQLQPSAQQLSAIDIIIVAVKPQDAAQACANIRARVQSHQLIISIMAGVTVQRLGELVGAEVAVVRSMPNLATQCGVGMTAYFCNASVSAAQQQSAQFLFESFGRSLRLEDESQIDAATALSGTGPAYFYFLLQQMQIVARECGFSPSQSGLLLEQTMEGALALWRETGLTPESLISKVASRGGTTEAALRVLQAGNGAQIMQDAVRAALQRSRELCS